MPSPGVYIPSAAKDCGDCEAGSYILKSLKNLNEVDELVCLAVPEIFYTVGQFYQDFDQTSDEEVVSILKSKK